MKTRMIVLVLGAIACVSVAAVAFHPAQHRNITLKTLEAAGFSYGQCLMLAYFNLEIDLATEVYTSVCNWIIDWPTEDYVCPTVGRVTTGTEDWCTMGPFKAGAFFDEWAEHCLPFHCPGPNPAKGIDGVIRQWCRDSIEGAMHPKAGERSYDWLKRVGWMLHAVQDFYAHSNWIEVFHVYLKFEFNQIPSWTSFMRAQRGAKTNLILLAHAKNNVTEARRLYDDLDKYLVVENHDLWNKDSEHENTTSPNDPYDNGSRDYHRNVLGHSVTEFHYWAVQVAGADTYLIGQQIRANIANNPMNGAARWNALFRCVDEMAAYDGISYEDELETYEDAISWFLDCSWVWQKDD
jgi:hypothetical protein